MTWRHRKRQPGAAACFAAIVFLPLAASAQNPSEWKCELCPFEDGYAADYQVGSSYVSDDATRFGNATGYDEKGAYLDLDGAGSYAVDGRYLDWYAEDLGRDSRYLAISGGRQGSYELDFAYRELPYRLFDTTQTVFTATSSDSLVLPAAWVRAPVTSGFTALDASLVPHDIESDRQILEFGGRVLALDHVSLFADYRRQDREGTGISSGSWYTQSSYLPRAIDYHTDEIDLGANYRSGAFDLTLAWYGSFFRNAAESLTWANPFTGFPGAEQGRMALEPDNDFQQFTLNGSYRSDVAATVVAFSAAVGQGEQDAALLPYTINAALAAGPLPRATAGGEVDTTNFAVTLTSRPMDIIRVKAAYRYDERDNTTAQDTWSRVITDSFISGDAERNIPYGFERTTIKLRADVDAFDDLTLSAGYDRRELDRDFQEVAEQTENSGWGQLRWTPQPSLDLRFRGGAAKREVDRYDQAVAESYGQNPLLRKYNLAYRYREFGEIDVFATAAEERVSINVTALYADDSYSQSRLGLTDGRETRVAAEISWNASERTLLYLHGGTEEIDANQLGSEAFANADWQTQHDDRYRYLGGGVQLTSIADKADLLLDYTRGKGSTRINVSGDAANAGPLPELRTVQDTLRLDLRYPWSERLDTLLFLRYEQYDSSDWALDGVDSATIPTVLTMGADAFNYDVWVVGLDFRYKVGPQQIEFPD